MHEYSTDSHDRRHVFYILAAVSGLLLAAVGYAAQLLTSFTNLAIATPSGLLGFVAVFLFFDSHIWHWKWLHRLGLVRIPDLRGRWAAELKTSKDPHVAISATLRVTQTYTRIMFRFETDTSFSRSRMATFNMTDFESFNIRWEYFAEPTSDPNGTNSFRHYGVTSMILSARKPADFRCTQKAIYYTEMDRDTSGTITFRYLGS